jgi:hypothetical protein
VNGRPQVTAACSGVEWRATVDEDGHSRSPCPYDGASKFAKKLSQLGRAFPETLRPRAPGASCHATSKVGMAFFLSKLLPGAPEITAFLRSSIPPSIRPQG